MRWPKSVPILEASDINRGGYNGPDGTHCLFGWVVSVFDIDPMDLATFDDRRPEGLLGRALYDACLKLSPKHMPKGYYVFSYKNDNRRNTKADIARAWNRAMAELGYTEGNPERPTKC